MDTVKSLIKNKVSKITGYFRNAFNLSKKIFKNEKALVTFIFIILIFPNIYEIENFVNKLFLLPLYLSGTINYLSFRSITDYMLKNSSSVNAVENIFLLIILKFIKDTFFIFLIGKCMGKLNTEKKLNSFKLLKKSSTAALIYLFPLYMCSIIPVFILRIIPKIGTVQALSLVMTLCVVFFQIVFLYFIPVYISGSVTLKEAYFKSLEAGKGNRKNIFLAVPLLILFLLLSIAFLAVSEFISELPPFSLIPRQNNLDFLSIPLNKAVLYIFATGIVKIIFTVFSACLISEVYLETEI